LNHRDKQRFMPEGPSIVILKEAVQEFKGQKLIEIGGNTKIELPDLVDQPVKDFKSWGKHFLICFAKHTIRIHFMLFGSYRINEKKETAPRLSLRFPNGELNLYACSVKMLDGAHLFIEKKIDESVKSFFKDAAALGVFNKNYNMPLVYGILFRKN